MAPNTISARCKSTAPDPEAHPDRSNACRVASTTRPGASTVAQWEAPGISIADIPLALSHAMLASAQLPGL